MAGLAHKRCEKQGEITAACADIEYTLAGALRTFDGVPQLYWDVNSSNLPTVRSFTGTVTGPDGAPVEVVPGTAAGFSISGGDRSGRVVGAVVPEHTGRHTVVVPDASPHGSEVFLAYVPATSSFALGLFGGVGGIVLGSLAGTAGLFLLVGGLVWGAVRKDPPPRAS